MDPNTFGISARAQVLSYVDDIWIERLIDSLFGQKTHKTRCPKLTLKMKSHRKIEMDQEKLYRLSLEPGCLFRF